MRSSIALLLFCIIPYCNIAQEKKHILYFETSSGIDNPSGIAGVALCYLYNSQHMVTLGYGLGSWSTKAALHYNYILSKGVNDIAIGTGLNFVPRCSDSVNGLYKINGNNMLLVNFTIRDYIKLNEHIIIYAGTGYSHNLITNKYTLQGNVTASELRFMEVLAPGGLMLNAGFLVKLWQ